MNAGEEISRELVVARGNGTKVLEFIEEALDEIALAIEGKVTRRWRFAVGFRRNHGGDFSSAESEAERIGVIGLVTDKCLWIDARKQWFGARQIVGLARREHNIDGIAERIDKDVNFGG